MGGLALQSRRQIFELKQRVEAATGLACGVVYGSLPPETRRAQAAPKATKATLYGTPNPVAAGVAERTPSTRQAAKTQKSEPQRSEPRQQHTVQYSLGRL